MASAILYVSLFLVAFLATTSIAQNQQNNVQGGGLLENKLKPLNNQQYNEFDWKLGKALHAKEYGNFVASPLSVKLALGMLYLGTQGLATKELEDAFNINSTVKETVEQRFSLLLKSLESKEEAYELNIGTKLFADLGTQINPEFSRKIKEYYNSSVHLVDFRNKQLTMSNINDWCNKITKGKIFQLVDEGDFNDDTVMMLLNALYFRGEWKFPFARNETKPQMFSVSRNRAVNVHMMSLTEKFAYYDMKEVRAHLIRLPYVGDRFAMYILYPYDVDGLAALAKEMKPDILAKSLSQRSEKTINLRLPKFKFESSAELVEVLKKLNIKELFSEKGYLENIGSSPKGPLVISNILQKSGIEVNEKGSSAYATTNVIIDSRFGTETAIDINITHPFIFLIADEVHNNMIFIGKVFEPLPVNDHHYAPSAPVSPPQGYQPNENVVNQAGLKPNQASQADLSEKLNYFDKELLIKTYHQAKPKENIVLSPASVKVMLALLLEGAAGQTEKELKDALRLPEDKYQALAILQQQLATIKNVNSPVKIDTQNKVFLAADEKLSKRYSEVLSKNYGAEFENVNFLKQDEAVNTINTWVTEVTRGLITSLVTKEDLDTETRLLLANCIYFKGEWKIAFDPKFTYTNYFYTPEPELKTKYMTAEIPIKFHEDIELDAKIAEIPFKDERYTFTIVLPNKKDGLTKLLRDLPHNSLLKLFSETKDTTVKVTLPRTSIQFKTPLADILSLRDIDIKDVFTSKANLTGILENNKPILVKDIFHNAKIELTEEGARAAAASGSHIVLLSASFIPEFKADHPFVYFIRDTYDSGFLFEGILSSPDSSNDPVTYLPVDNRNGFETRPSLAVTSPPPGRSTTRKAASSQRPNGSSAQQPQPSANRPNGNNQQPPSNRISGTNQPASPQNPTPRPVVGYQLPRPSEKGSVEYPILQGEQ